MKRETVVVLDFGGQYNQLIARRVRECNVYCEIYSYKTDIEKIKEIQPKGIIFTGGPNSVYLEDSPKYAEEIYQLANSDSWNLLRIRAYDASAWRKGRKSACT